MNKIEQILNRNDYKRLSARLESVCETLATKILDKMIELQLSKVYCDEAGTLQRKGYESIKEDGVFYNGGRIDKVNWDARSDGAYLGYLVASHMQQTTFLNNVHQLLQRLDEIESEQCAQIEAALASTADLVDED